jgi:hypothetical protein
MTDDLDRILASEGALIPSAGFADRVMKEIRRVCEATAPLRFPWRRFLAGLVGGGVCTLLSGAVLLAQGPAELHFPGLASWLDATQWSRASDSLLLTVAFVGSLFAVRVSVDIMSE